MKNYYVSKDEKSNEVVYLEYDKMDGYKVSPKVSRKDEIEVSKIVFVNQEFSEKIIRRKIDKKIEYLLKQLKLIDEDDSGNEGTIRKSLMDAEKLRLQIINNYVKYLGHTYKGLTLEKLQIIINQLRYKLYMIQDIQKEMYYESEREGRRGR